MSNQHCTKIVSLCTSALRLYLLPLRAHILQVQDAHLGHLVSFSLRTLHAVHESRDLILQVLYIKDPSVTDNVPFPQMFALLQTHNAVSLHFTDSWSYTLYSSTGKWCTMSLSYTLYSSTVNGTMMYNEFKLHFI